VTVAGDEEFFGRREEIRRRRVFMHTVDYFPMAVDVSTVKRRKFVYVALPSILALPGRL
jgi:hypothetical protein